ncbi:MAG: hypothetical protein A2381_13260 [Bdellovibrionales bacterium RIFOXYB1_FULL_37_110]|nr:MAG: hypothetical protein A2181_02585 [Bdellovibrionales bacterium RIFOXYA1_FULL_38_20]OFZ51671.1 MAG: hypothetical protein A2417_12920 [Bdellovibrionales bacterium RIFOXYC1_FULL_37_79]OFZ60498.1 MAG: hypothetical protein A2381_13260 [Bdellovibrionales bacterium RIFOXYB1_FULL_37_110]OFZ65072.1 MAG: hypothetical protein A2577_09525 [Bdellovibrionales bacterium RIFOXYD1_FULL_36_51]HAB51303.1 hypothetical protein [Ignavibacteriales bacterium]
MSIRLACLLLVFVLLGCATVGSKFDFKGPNSIRTGETTRNDIINLYGEPFRVGYDNDNLVWTYGHYKYRLFGPTETKDLRIMFDKKGLVKDYTYSTSVDGEKEKLMLSTFE